DPDLLGGPDQQGALRNPDRPAVDDDPHEVVCLGGRVAAVGEGHRAPPTAPADGAQAVDSEWSNGHPWSRWARYSSRKYCSEETIGLPAPSPRAQNDFPTIELVTSARVSRSAAVPPSCSRRSSNCTSQYVPSRQGVHLPQDSCA